VLLSGVKSCYARQGAPPASSSATKELIAAAIRVTSRINNTSSWSAPRLASGLGGATENQVLSR
jgi:hypothetical protein